MKTTYLALKTITETKLAKVAHVGKWNEQIDNIQDEIPFLRPAIFFEFNLIEWVETTKNGKRGNLTITLHLITDNYGTDADDTDALAAMDFLENASALFDGLKLDNCTPLTPLNTMIDHNHGNLIHNTLHYSVEISQCISQGNYQQINPALKITAKINP